MPPCDVAGCPSLAAPGHTVCPPHQHATTATLLGQTGHACIACGRAFKADDFVRREPERQQKPRRPGIPYGYAHVACQPVQPRRADAGPSLFD